MSEGNAAGQIKSEEWAADRGEKWLANLERLESMISPAAQAFKAHVPLRPGERVVDIGCGAGETTIGAAQAVAPTGEALGIDISPVLVEKAKRRAAAADVRNVRFQVADASTVKPENAPFDRLISRFGSMFFPDFGAAFKNLRQLVRDGGRADLAVWGPIGQNLWASGMQDVVRALVDVPTLVPHAPGPFAFDDPDFLRPLLLDAGFRSVDFVLWQGDQRVGGAGSDPESAAEFALNAFSFADALKDKDEAKETGREQLVKLFARYYTSDGVRMPAAVWFVTAAA